MKLNTRLLIFIVAFSTLFFSISGIVYQKSYNALNERILIDAALVAERINNHLQSNINFIEEDMKLFAVSMNLNSCNFLAGTIQSSISPMLKRRFVSFFEIEYGYKLYETVIIYDSFGKIIASAIPQSFAKPPSWDMILKGEASTQLIKTNKGTTAVSISIPLEDCHGKTWGVMQGITTLSALVHGEGISLPNLNVNQADILTPNGKILYSTALHVSDEIIKDQNLFQKLKYGGEIITNNANGENELIVSKAYQHTDNDSFSWVLMLYLDYNKLFAKILALRWLIGVSACILILLSISFFLVISKAVVTPLNTISKTAKKLGEGNLSERIKDHFSSEFNLLINSFNSMAENIEKNREQLENKVQDRTNHLLHSNAKLLKEIEERKHIQAELLQIHSRLQDAQQLAGLGYWTWNVSTGAVIWSDEVYNIFNLSPEEFTPSIDSILALSPWPEEQARDKELIKKATQNHEKGEYEQKFLRPDGSYAYYHSSFQGQYNEDATLHQINGTIVDITKRKLAEEAVKESEARLKLAAQSSGLALWEYNRDKNQITVSDHWFIIRNISREEWTGSIAQASEGLHPEDQLRVMKAIEKLRSGDKDSIDVEYRFKRNNGDWNWEHVIAKVTERNSAGEISKVMGSLKDITSKKNLEQQLALTRKLESVGQLAAGIAHEINTPLQYISGNLKFMHDSFIELKENNDALQQLISINEEEKKNEQNQLFENNHELLIEMGNATQESISGVDQISKIVQAMKQFSHPGGAGRKKVDLNDVIKKVITISRNEWKYVSTIKFNLDEGLPFPTVDPDEINQILLNLVVNAVDAIKDRQNKNSAQGQITISTSKETDTSIRLSVADNGAGIPSNIIDRVFDPFFTTKEIGKGTGQGLSIVYAIIERYHGNIEVESVPEQGTTFTIKIPIS